MKQGGRHSTDARRRIGEATRAAMAAPEVRQRISERTKEGMGSLTELRRLRAAWNEARLSVRRTFVDQLLAPLFEKVQQP